MTFWLWITYSSHKVQGIIDAVEAVNANVVFLPQYSPDLNPIETIWSELKADLRKSAYPITAPKQKQGYFYRF